MISYGFEPAVVEQWFADKSQSMEQLQSDYRQAQAELIQDMVATSSDYMKGILDNAITDLRSRVEDKKSEVFSEVDSEVADWKEQVDSATQAQLDAIQEWLDQVDQAAQDFSEMDLTNSTDTEWVSLAEVKATTQKAHKSHKSSYAYGAVTIGAAAGLAFYLNKQRNAKGQSNIDKQTLLEDEEFVMV